MLDVSELNCDTYFEFLEKNTSDSRIQQLAQRARKLIKADAQAEKVIASYLIINIRAWLDIHGIESIEAVKDYSGILSPDHWKRQDTNVPNIFLKIKDGISIYNLISSCDASPKTSSRILDVCGGCGNIAFTLGLQERSGGLEWVLGPGGPVWMSAILGVACWANTVSL